MFTIHLIVDNTAETLSASKFAFDLSTACGDRLHAHAVLDGNTLLHATGFTGTPGLCGSGVFLEAYEQMRAIAVGIQESLMMSLRSKAGDRKVSMEEHIAVGDPVMLICEKATDDSLFVLGGHPQLAQAIFEKTHCPVLIMASRAGDPPQVLVTPGRRGDVAELMEVSKLFAGMKSVTSNEPKQGEEQKQVSAESNVYTSAA